MSGDVASVLGPDRQALAAVAADVLRRGRAVT